MSKTFGINKMEEHLENFSKSHFSSLRFEVRGFQFEQAFEMHSNMSSIKDCSKFQLPFVFSSNGMFFRSPRYGIEDVDGNSSSLIIS
jgi:hypothetical protein